MKNELLKTWLDNINEKPTDKEQTNNYFPEFNFDVYEFPDKQPTDDHQVEYKSATSNDLKQLTFNSAVS